MSAARFFNNELSPPHTMLCSNVQEALPSAALVGGHSTTTAAAAAAVVAVVCSLDFLAAAACCFCCFCCCCTAFWACCIWDTMSSHAGRSQSSSNVKDACGLVLRLEYREVMLEDLSAPTMVLDLMPCLCVDSEFVLDETVGRRTRGNFWIFMPKNIHLFMQMRIFSHR